LKISNSTASNNDKINILIHFLSHLETDDQWPDYDEMIRKNDALLEEVRILKQVEEERNTLLKKVNLLEKKVEYLENRLIATATHENENTHLQTIVDLFLRRTVSNNQKRQLADFCNKGFAPSIKYALMIDYLKKLKSVSAYQAFKLSEEDKIEIRRILTTNKNKDQGIQELLNYIEFVFENKNKNLYKRLIRKGENMKRQ
jgi:hypothetical protein